MKLHVWKTEKHIQVNEFNADSINAFYTFWKDLQDKYMGFTIDFCYHNCSVPVDFMLEINAKVLESCIETRLNKELFTPVYDYELTLITNENFAEFAVLHDNTNPLSSMYWTSERIKKDLSRWVIYIYRNNYVLMNLGGNVSEIYAIKTTDKNIGKALISKASEYAFKAGKTGVLQMVEDDALTELEMTQSVGFVPCGKYICYQSIIRPLSKPDTNG